MKYKDILMSGTEVLKKNEIPDFEFDAWELFSMAFDIEKKDYFLISMDECNDKEKQSRYMELIEQRVLRIPLQHIIGHTGFMGLDFIVDSSVLCPRQDTEILVEKTSEKLKPGMKLLDLCTGSGCVLISLMHLVSSVDGTGVDISKSALEIAGKNAKKNFVHPTFLEGDLFSPVKGKVFDIITANPPYIPSDIIPKLMPEVRDHEPLNALDGDSDGLKYYRLITEAAPDYLADGGWLFYEIGVDQRVDVMTIMFERGFSDIHCYKDYSGNDRVVCGQWYKEKNNV